VGRDNDFTAGGGVSHWPRRAERRIKQRQPQLALGMGFGRIVASEIEAPIPLANLVERGGAVLQSNNATEPYLDTALPARVGGHQRPGTR
jgi:hypothetical protein